MFIPIGDDNSGRVLTPFVVFALIAANAAMWFLQLSAGQSFTYGWATIPYEITHGVDLVRASAMEIHGRETAIPQFPGPHPIYFTLLSSMFMHGGWMHILGNMLYLWIFGDQIEDLLGHGRFLLFYLACGLGAGFAQIALQPDSVIPNLGASGAIAGVLGAYLIKYPRNPVRVLMWRYVTHLPAAVVLGMWILLQVFSQVSTPAGQASGIAYMAHIGGFAVGAILIFILARGRPAARRRPGLFPGRRGR